MKHLFAMFTMVGAVLLISDAESVRAQAEMRSVTISNNSGKDVTYRYRAGENTGKARPYTTVTHRNGTTLKLNYTTSGAADYGILLRMGNEAVYGRIMSETLSPYEIRANGAFFDANKKEINEISRKD